MVEYLGPVRGPERTERPVRYWKVVAAAWALVLVVALALIAGHLFRAPPNPATVETPAQAFDCLRDHLMTYHLVPETPQETQAPGIAKTRG